MAKNLPVIQQVQETLFQSLGQEDPLEESIATHTSTLPGEPHGQRSGGPQSVGLQRVRHD